MRTQIRNNTALAARSAALAARSAALAALGLALLLPAGAWAQLANASPRTLGMGGNTTATAQRLEALSVNPAGLAMPGGGGFSLALVPVTVRQGLGPVTLADIADQGGKLVPVSVKEDWLSRIEESGSQSGSFGVEVSGIVFTVGRFGLQLSTLVGGEMSVAPDIAEVALYGNAGRTGSPANLSLSGSSAQGFAVSTAGLSFAHPMAVEGGAVAVGATLKYSMGHVLALGREQGGSIQSDPIKVNVNLPLVSVDDDDIGPVAGSGAGLDLGLQLQRDRLRLGAAILNLFHSFAWDESKLVFRAGTASLEEGDNATDFEKRPYASAPAVLKTAVEDMGFSPTLSVGGAYDLSPGFTVAADVRNRFGEGMSLVPKLHVGLGAEYRGLRVLHLRGGAAVVTDGFQLGGGAGLYLGPVAFSVAGAIQRGDMPDTNIAQFTLSFGGK